MASSAETKSCLGGLVMRRLVAQWRIRAIARVREPTMPEFWAFMTALGTCTTTFIGACVLTMLGMTSAAGQVFVFFGCSTIALYLIVITVRQRIERRVTAVKQLKTETIVELLSTKEGASDDSC